MSFLGIDIGTSGVKVVAFDKKGSILKEARRSYSVVSSQHGYAELDALMVGNYTLEVIREVSKNLEDKVQSISISAIGEAFTMIDEKGIPLCPAMVSSDFRAADIAKEWTEKFGKDKLYHITGHTAHPLFSLFKILWIKNNQPEIWEKCARILCFEDYLQLLLGIDPCISYSLAGRTLLFDIKRESWSKEILEYIGLDENKLSRPVASGILTGRIPDSVASRLNLPPDVQIFSGGHDQGCAALGAGVSKKGVAMYALGTVECIAPSFTESVFSDQLKTSNLCTYHHCVPEMYLSLAYSLTGGNLIEWIKKLFFSKSIEDSTKTNSVYEDMFKNIGITSTNIFCLPYFTPSGTPYFSNKPMGALLGLDLNTSQEEIISALLEGVSLEMKLNLQILQESGIKVEHFNMVGGGAKNALLVQMKANIMNVPITVMEVTEAGCMACAMFGASSILNISMEELSSQWIKFGQTYIPEKSKAAFYDNKFLKYKELFPLISSLSI